MMNTKDPGKISAAPTTADGRSVTYSPAWADPEQWEAARSTQQGTGSVAREASMRERSPLPAMTVKEEQTPASRRFLNFALQEIEH